MMHAIAGGATAVSKHLELNRLTAKRRNLTLASFRSSPTTTTSTLTCT